MLTDVFLQGGGEMGELIRTFDWSQTSLGIPKNWSLALKIHIKTMLDNQVGTYITWGPDYIQIYNDAYRPVLGLSKHPQALGSSCRDTFSEVWETVEPMFKEVMKGNPVGFKEFMFPLDRNGDGKIEECYFDFSYTPLYHEDGYVSGIVVTVMETTEQVKSVRMLRQNESNLRNLVLTAPVAMCLLMEKNFKVEIANERMIELWGTTRDAVLKKPIFEGLPEVKNQGFEQLLEGVYNTGVTFSADEHPVILPRSAGLKTVFVNFTYDAFKDNEGHIIGVLVVAVDVTKLVESRHKIEELEKRARLAIDSANIGTFDIDLNSNILIASPRLNEIFGLPEGSPIDAYRDLYHPDDRHIRDEAVKKSLADGTLVYQVRIVLKNKEIRWVRFHGSSFKDSNGKPYRLIGTVLDITTTIEIQQQKDDFLAIASHELKTPLTSLKGYTYMLETLIRKGDQVVSLNIIKKSQRQVDKMAKLIYTFLDVSRIENAQFQLNKENFDFNVLISETINYYNVPEYKERIRFSPGNIPRMDADREKIGHVIDNLVSNALKYSPDDKQIFIESYSTADSIIFSVKDHGKGIDLPSQSKIFQRFFRANNVREGVASGFGIGLYFSSQVIKLHNGKIWFKSEEGKGSTFYFSKTLQ